MSAQCWEPWTPEVGQRVRVRLSGECQFAEQNGGAHTVFIASNRTIICAWPSDIVEPFSEDGVIGRAAPAVWPMELEPIGEPS
jgi:hypothetical protein